MEIISIGAGAKAEATRIINEANRYVKEITINSQANAYKEV